MGIERWIEEIEKRGLEVSDRWRNFSKVDGTHRAIIWETDIEPGYLVAITFISQDRYKRAIPIKVIYKCRKDFDTEYDSDDPNYVKSEIYEYISSDGESRSVEHFIDPDMKHIIPPSDESERSIYMSAIQDEYVFAVNSIVKDGDRDLELDIQYAGADAQMPGLPDFAPGNTFISGLYDFPDHIKLRLHISRADIQGSHLLKLESQEEESQEEESQEE
jgi:hypothetical protein